MPRTPVTPVETTTRHSVAVYLFLSVGIIVGTIAGIAFLFSGK